MLDALELEEAEEHQLDELPADEPDDLPNIVEEEEEEGETAPPSSIPKPDRNSDSPKPVLVTRSPSLTSSTTRTGKRKSVSFDVPPSTSSLEDPPKTQQPAIKMPSSRAEPTIKSTGPKVEPFVRPTKSVVVERETAPPLPPMASPSTQRQYQPPPQRALQISREAAESDHEDETNSVPSDTEQEDDGSDGSYGYDDDEDEDEEEEELPDIDALLLNREIALEYHQKRFGLGAGQGTGALGGDGRAWDAEEQEVRLSYNSLLEHSSSLVIEQSDGTNRFYFSDRQTDAIPRLALLWRPTPACRSTHS